MTTWDSASLTKLFQTTNKVYKIKQSKLFRCLFHCRMKVLLFSRVDHNVICYLEKKKQNTKQWQLPLNDVIEPSGQQMALLNTAPCTTANETMPLLNAEYCLVYF